MNNETTATEGQLWWERPGLEARDGRLLIAGRDAERLAREHGTPLMVFDLTFVQERLRALQAAFRRAQLPHRVRIALKAERSPALLAAVRALGAPGSEQAVGIDACSPGEVEHALAHGFLPEEISVTGTNLTERDVRAIIAHSVHLNADLLTQLERIGRLAPGSHVGLRLNPKAGVLNRRSDVAIYSDARPTKFGIYAEDLGGAVEIARRHGLIIDTAHVHVTNGVLDEDLPALERVFTTVADMVETLLEFGCPIEEVNAGGGLGVRLNAGQRPLDLDAYVSVLASTVGRFGKLVSCEPGEWVSSLSAILLAEVATVEDRLGSRFVGLDVGWNVVNHHALYKIQQPFVHATRAQAEPIQSVVFTGNINEGLDIFNDDCPFPEVCEGEIVAMLSVGCYTLTQYCPHCLRPPATTIFYPDRT